MIEPGNSTGLWLCG